MFKSKCGDRGGSVQGWGKRRRRMAEEKPFFRSCEGQIRFPALPSTFQVHGSSPLGCNIGGKKLRSGKNSKGKSRISSEFNESDSKKRKKNREISSFRSKKYRQRWGKVMYLPWEKSFRDISLCIFSVRCPYFQRIFFSPWLSKENEEKKKKRKIYRRKERETRFLIKARYDPSAVRGTSVHQNLPHELRQAGQINRDIYMRAEQSRNF